MPIYTITEPHPSVAQNSWMHSGRGGAGNLFRAPATTDPAGVPTIFSLPAADPAPGRSKRFYSGRGGAGNAHAAAARPLLCFDDEYRQAEARAAVAAHVGRGGAGNVAKLPKEYRKSFSSSHGATSSRRDSTCSRRDSTSTAGSARPGFWRRLGWRRC